MKLTNPKPDELRHVFAMKVAKYTLSQYGEYFTEAGLFAGSRSTLPPWDTSMDAVLPWLERLGWRGTSNRAGSTCAATVEVNHPDCDGRTFLVQQDYTHTQTPFPRAAVIALLRAHGVEVEFTP